VKRPSASVLGACASRCRRGTTIEGDLFREAGVARKERSLVAIEISEESDQCTYD